MYNIKSIGSCISELEFSKEEKKRISILVESDDPIMAQMLRSTFCKTEAFQKFQDIFKKKGFRKGKVSTNGIITEFRKELKNDQESLWNIYKIGFATFVRNNCKHLQELLISIEVDPIEIGTELLLRKLALNSQAFNVQKQDIEFLYKYWGFERVENSNEIFELCDIYDEASHILKKASDNSEEISVIKAKSEGRSKKIQENHQYIEDIKVRLNKLEKKIDEYITKGNTDSGLMNELATIKNKLEIESDKTKANKDHLTVSFEKVQQLGMHSQESEELININAQGIARNSKKSETLQETVKAKIDKITKEYAKLLYSLDEKSRQLMNEVQTLRSDLNELCGKFSNFTSNQNPTRSRQESLDLKEEYASPFHRIRVGENDNNFCITDERTFIHIWGENLKNEYNLSYSLEHLIVLHSIISTSKVVILEKDELFSSWLNIMNWSQYTLKMVSSPMWSKEVDWKAGINHLFSSYEEDVPKILMIYDFNEAMVPCYLLPTIKSWFLSEETFQNSKIVLIPSEGSGGKIDESLLGYSYYIKPNNSYESLPQFQGAGLQDLEIDYESEIKGVNPSLFRDWLICDSINANERLDQVETELHIKITKQIRIRMKELVAPLSKYYGEENAKNISLLHTVEPWLRLLYGAEKGDELIDILSGLDLALSPV